MFNRRGVQRLGVNPGAGDCRAGVGVFFGELLGGKAHRVKVSFRRHLARTPPLSVSLSENDHFWLYSLLLSSCEARGRRAVTKVTNSWLAHVSGFLVRCVELDLQVVADVPVHGEALISSRRRFCMSMAVSPS